MTTQLVSLSDEDLARTRRVPDIDGRKDGVMSRTDTLSKQNEISTLRSITVVCSPVLPGTFIVHSFLQSVSSPLRMKCFFVIFVSLCSALFAQGWL